MKAIVVLGCKVNEDGKCSRRLSERVRVAVDYYRKSSNNNEVVLILSGYKSSGPVSEAKAAAMLCCELGVKNQALLLEEEASNTIENATKTLPLAVKIGVTEMLVVTSDFHVNRSKAIFESVYHGSGIKLSYAEARGCISPNRFATLQLEEESKIMDLSKKLKPMMANASM